MSTPSEPPADPWASPLPGAGHPSGGTAPQPYLEPGGAGPGGSYGAPYGAPYGQYGAPYGSGAPTRAGNGLGTAALVLGIIAVLLGVVLIGGLFGLVAIVLGIVGRGRARRGQATNGGAALAGALLGALGVTIAMAVIVTVFAVFAEPISNYRQCINRAGNNVAAQQVCNVNLRDRLEDRFR